MVQRVIILAAVLLTLSLSVASFMNNGLHEDLDATLQSSLAHIIPGIGVDIVVMLLIMITLLVGMLDERRLGWSLFIAWLLYLPPVLHYSRIDWSYILGLGDATSLLENSLPDAFIMLNGAVLVGTSVLVRSFREVRGLRRNLLDRKGSAPEVDEACARNMLFNAWIVTASVVSVVTIWIIVTLISSLMDWQNTVGPEYLWTALIAAFILLVMFAIMVASKDWIDNLVKGP